MLVGAMPCYHPHSAGWGHCTSSNPGVINQQRLSQQSSRCVDVHPSASAHLELSDALPKLGALVAVRQHRVKASLHSGAAGRQRKAECKCVRQAAG